MKIARFTHEKAISFGILDEDADELVLLRGDPMFAGLDTTGERLPMADVEFLAPVIPRSKIIAVGKNYHAHATEMGGEAPTSPLIFLKPNTAVVGPGDDIRLPADSEQVEYEGELAVVIGAVARNVAVEDFAEVVFGYTIANDVTARDIQRTESQWARAKGYDTFCPLGPVIETELAWDELNIETRLNGKVVQQGSTAEMVHSVPELVAFASRIFTLLPGDIILTGTPAGVGRVANGDTVAIDISGIGTLFNPVVGATGA